MNFVNFYEKLLGKRKVHSSFKNHLIDNIIRFGPEKDTKFLV